MTNETLSVPKGTISVELVDEHEWKLVTQVLTGRARQIEALEKDLYRPVLDHAFRLAGMVSDIVGKFFDSRPGVAVALTRSELEEVVYALQRSRERALELLAEETGSVRREAARNVNTLAKILKRLGAPLVRQIKMLDPMAEILPED